jgi:hypothetical protein
MEQQQQKRREVLELENIEKDLTKEKESQKDRKLNYLKECRRVLFDV